MLLGLEYRISDNTCMSAGIEISENLGTDVPMDLAISARGTMKHGNLLEYKHIRRI